MKKFNGDTPNENFTGTIEQMWKDFDQDAKRFSNGQNLNEMDQDDNVVIYYDIPDFKKRFDRIVRGAYKETDEWG